MKCPKCGTEDAYLGMFDVDCPNPDCRHYQGGDKGVIPPATTANPAAPAPAPAPAPIAVANLTVSIIDATPKRNSVEIKFKADGDPGFPDKTVEFEFWVPGVLPKTICTLSNKSGIPGSVTGIDANGSSIYTTHWKCNTDGVSPNDPWKLEATIYP